MANFKDLLQNPETLEEMQDRWFRKLRSWVPQGVFFENIESQQLSETVLDTIEQPDFGDVRDIASVNPINIFNLLSDTTETVGISVTRDFIGQTFTPATTFQADKVGFDVRNINSFFGSVTIEIYATSAGLPVGGPIATTLPLLVGALNDSHGTVAMFNLASPVTLTGSVQYAVILNKGDADGDISLALQSSGDVFAGGTYLETFNDGGTWSLNSAKDVVFQVSGFSALATLTGRAAQQFTTDRLGKLNAIALALHTDVAASTGTLRVEIQGDALGSPDGDVYGFFDIDVTTLPVGPTGLFVGYVPTVVKNLAGDVDYWIVFKNTVLPDAQILSETKLGGGYSNPYKVSFDSGNIWSVDVSLVDISFQVITEREADADLDGFNVAVFQSFAAVLATVERSLAGHTRETYICLAEGAYLSEHGGERNVSRATNELDISYRERIKNITNSTSCPTIKRLVDALLPVGEATLFEDFESGLFYSREEFFNRGAILIDPIYNAFTIIVDKQIHPPYSFYNREYFANRDDFIGQQESRIELFEIIVEAVNSAKALGTVYRLVERLG